MLRQVTHRDGSVRQVHLGGWKKQLRDDRDAGYALKLSGGLFTGTLPAKLDQRAICSPVEDQGDLGSCTANMTAALIEANERRAAAKAVLQGSNPTVTVGTPTLHVDGSVSFTTTVRLAQPPAPPTPTPAPTPPPTPAPTPTPAPGQLIRVSRLLEYYATRKIENTVSTDSGASIRDAIKAAAQYGCCDEALWPYDISKYKTNPPDTAWAAAATHKVTSYHSITDGDLATMKAAIAGGYLVGFGFVVYSYMMSQAMATHGYLPLPASSEQQEGGHAVALVGWDDTMTNPSKPSEKGAVLVRNSWGTDWGQQGYFWMAYDYLTNTNLCNDFWVVQSAAL